MYRLFFLSKFVGVMARVSLIREASVFIFKDTGGLLFSKSAWIINNSI